MNTRRRLVNMDRVVEYINRLIVIAVIVSIIYPILFVVLTSLKTTKEFYSNVWGIPQQIAWSNYPTAWNEGRIGPAFLTSAFVVSVSILVILVFGALAGYAFARLEIPKAELIVVLLVATTMFPSESVIMPIYITLSKAGLIGTHYSLIIPYIGWSLPITIYIFRDFFQTLPVDLIESARIDGSNELGVFLRIMLPLMLPAIATCAIFNFVNLWGELLWATIALASQSTIRTIPMGVVEFKGQFSTDWGPLSAAICIVLLPLIIFFLFVQKYFVQGLTAGAVKA